MVDYSEHHDSREVGGELIVGDSLASSPEEPFIKMS